MCRRSNPRAGTLGGRRTFRWCHHRAGCTSDSGAHSCDHGGQRDRHDHRTGHRRWCSGDPAGAGGHRGDGQTGAPGRCLLPSPRRDTPACAQSARGGHADGRYSSPGLATPAPSATSMPVGPVAASAPRTLHTSILDESAAGPLPLALSIGSVSPTNPSPFPVPQAPMPGPIAGSTVASDTPASQGGGPLGAHIPLGLALPTLFVIGVGSSSDAPRDFSSISGTPDLAKHLCCVLWRTRHHQSTEECEYQS